LATHKNPHPNPTNPSQDRPDRARESIDLPTKDARVHCAVLNVRKMTTTPPPPARTHKDNPRGSGGTTTRWPPRSNGHPLPQDPTACLPPAPRITTFHTLPHANARSTSRTSSDTRSPAELVSVPPSSSTPDTRSHPRRGDHHGLSVALDHHNQCGGQCSLERR